VGSKTSNSSLTKWWRGLEDELELSLAGDQPRTTRGEIPESGCEEHPGEELVVHGADASRPGAPGTYAEIFGFPPAVFVKLALQEQWDRAGVKMSVQVEAA